VLLRVSVRQVKQGASLHLFLVWSSSLKPEGSSGDFETCGVECSPVPQAYSECQLCSPLQLLPNLEELEWHSHSLSVARTSLF